MPWLATLMQIHKIVRYNLQFDQIREPSQLGWNTTNQSVTRKASETKMAMMRMMMMIVSYNKYIKRLVFSSTAVWNDQSFLTVI
jgi:hypothetical protein